MRVEKILDSVSDGSRDEKIEKSKYDKRQVGSGNSKENVMWKEGNWIVPLTSNINKVQLLVNSDQKTVWLDVFSPPIYFYRLIMDGKLIGYISMGHIIEGNKKSERKTYLKIVDLEFFNCMELFRPWASTNCQKETCIGNLARTSHLYQNGMSRKRNNF